MGYIVAHQPLARIDNEGEERQKIWQGIVADIKMFYMVGYTRVGPRVDFTPDISTNSELQIAKVKFKE